MNVIASIVATALVAFGLAACSAAADPSQGSTGTGQAESVTPEALPTAHPTAEPALTVHLPPPCVCVCGGHCPGECEICSNGWPDYVELPDPAQHPEQPQPDNSHVLR